MGAMDTSISLGMTYPTCRFVALVACLEVRLRERPAKYSLRANQFCMENNGHPYLRRETFGDGSVRRSQIILVRRPRLPRTLTNYSYPQWRRLFVIRHNRGRRNYPTDFDGANLRKARSLRPFSRLLVPEFLTSLVQIRPHSQAVCQRHTSIHGGHAHQLEHRKRGVTRGPSSACRTTGNRASGGRVVCAGRPDRSALRESKAHVEKLTHSILAKAFRGELVPQDPTTNPVPILLERIRLR